MRQLIFTAFLFTINLVVNGQDFNKEDFPPNSIEKKGWRLVISDEFNVPSLNEQLWIPYYFRHRDRNAKALYTFRQGCLVLQLDSGRRVSSIQTIERTNLHKLGKDSIPTLVKFAQKYGYFEIRAKTQYGSGHNSAFWLVGVQNNSKQTAEIDVFEQPGHLGEDLILFNLYGWGDSSLVSKKGKGNRWPNKLNLKKDLSKTFNVYGLEWTPKSLKLYFNNQLIKVIPKSPRYPMGVLLSLYERSDWLGPIDKSIPYPKEFIIDYFRVYEKK
ncbi:family 16 glycosylhydrolase [Leadbetterella byssophila]|uniref:glycoside hydrolase family 16 protein n=1 Tax=Leadbetterella byssophila TaxID=316068 RepID=UPI0039A0A2A4